MCGICGVVRFDGRPIDAGAMSAACASLRHRGPDHTGIWFDRSNNDEAALGTARLTVIGPSPSCNQPLYDATGRYHLVFNGAIYNFRELRRELETLGDSFLTDGDTEVILMACARWGVDALRRFNGMWAFAFHDSHARTGFLARDRFGIKPLIYSADDHALMFASELRAIQRLGGADGEVDPTALIQLLRYGYIAAPATILRDAKRLPPGHYLSFSQERLESPQAFYALTYATPRGHDYTQARTELRRLIADAVVRRRVADVPLGAFLSGGLDSAIIAYHLAEADGRAPRTFSIGYVDQPGYDETRYARLAAAHIGTDHCEIQLTEKDVLGAIPRVLDHLDEPFGDSSIVPTSLVSAAARQELTVALSGDGGDELFGGYWRYLGHASLASYERIPSTLRHWLIEPAVRRAAMSKSSIIGNRARQFRKLLRGTNSDPLARHLAWSRILAPEAEVIFKDPEQASVVDAAMLAEARSGGAYDGGGDLLNHILAFDLRHPLPGDMLRKVDAASMMHSLEVRVPFLDHTVVEFAMSLPSSFKIDRGQRKRILVDAYRGRLPDEILDRSKQGFEVPIGEYLRGPLREMFYDTVTRDAVESFGLLSHDGVGQVYADHLARRGEHADLLFALLSLCWWRRSL